MHIIDFNQSLLTQFEQSYTAPDSCEPEFSSIPRVFQQRVDQIRSYSGFVNNYDQMTKRIKDLRADKPEFDLFMTVRDRVVCGISFSQN